MLLRSGLRAPHAHRAARCRRLRLLSRAFSSGRRRLHPRRAPPPRRLLSSPPVSLLRPCGHRVRAAEQGNVPDAEPARPQQAMRRARPWILIQYTKDQCSRRMWNKGEFHGSPLSLVRRRRCPLLESRHRHVEPNLPPGSTSGIPMVLLGPSPVLPNTELQSQYQLLRITLGRHFQRMPLFGRSGIV